VANAALTVSGIIATQLLTPFKSSGCTSDDEASCSSNDVDVTSKEAFNDTDGPNRFTNYTLGIVFIRLVVKTHTLLLKSGHFSRQIFKLVCIEWTLWL